MNATNYLSKSVRVMQIIGAALLTGVAIFLAIALYMVHGGDGAILAGPPDPPPIVKP